ncbi:MAG: YceI family protein [Pseudomonadales bacterium]|jgi:polyisoprenoid-binding protein YceI|nr:YceI family protein [Pseudomonadales bacterium]
MKNVLPLLPMLMASLTTPAVLADTYKIDIEGQHAFVQFRVKHLGYSWLYGRFDDFTGEFTYDPAQPEASSISVTVDMTSLDSDHAERDKHVRSADYLNVGKYSKATFESTAVEMTGERTARLVGNLTFFGTTRPLTIDVEHIGGGPDPWGGYRQGFEGRAVLKPEDFGLDLTKKLGPATAEVELMLTVEGIRM